VEAVSKWKIAPARAKGVSIEATINVPVLFLPESSIGKTNPGSFTQLVTPRQPGIAYPASWQRQNRCDTGIVTLEFALDDNGRPQNPVVVRSTDRECDALAPKDIRKYHFQKPTRRIRIHSATFARTRMMPAGNMKSYTAHFRIPFPPGFMEGMFPVRCFPQKAWKPSPWFILINCSRPISPAAPR
jgi:hypothetical protein